MDAQKQRWRLWAARDWKALGVNVSLIVLGSLVYVLGMNAVLIPQKLLSGGVVGVAVILHYLYPSVDVGHFYLVSNIPLMLLGWFSVSRRFMGYTLFGMVFFSLAASWVKVPSVTVSDPLLAAVLAGVWCGVGGGIMLRSLGSAGGLDILAVYLNTRWGIRVGVTYMAANAVVLGVGGYFFGLEKALFSIVYVYASGRVVDAVMVGFNRRKMVLIISSKAQETADFILYGIRRGVTFLKGTGGYSGEDRDVILTVTTLTELPKLKEAIFRIDPHAFVIINDTLEVLGKRHGTLKVY
uniref:YitT family protein n=1 Tax=Desulfacinum infernum TaxID=35837 RepID=A0A832A0U0_9BACT